jgi:hypothetical protein
MSEPSHPPRGPFAASAGRCGAAADGVTGFRPCQRPVTHAGTKTYHHPRRTTWLSFSCDHHTDYLDEPHQLTSSERVELDDRREQERRGRAGLPYRRPQPLRESRRREPPGNHSTEPP